MNRIKYSKRSGKKCQNIGIKEIICWQQWRIAHNYPVWHFRKVNFPIKHYLIQGGEGKERLAERGSRAAQLGWLLRFLWGLSMYLKEQKYFERKEKRDENVDWWEEDMGISYQAKKRSSGRPGSCKASSHAPQRGHAVQRRSTPIRTVNIRPFPLRNARSSKRAQTPHSRPRSSSHSVRRCSTQLHEQLTAHPHSGCTFYCYFFYFSYCCCLMVLSVSLFFLLSPPPNTSPSVSSPTLPSNSIFLQYPTYCMDEFCFFHPEFNLTSSAVPLYCPVPPCLIFKNSFHLFLTSSREIATSEQHSSSHPSSTPAPSSSTSGSFTPSHNPILCRPWPSTRSLSSLLLCPPSFGDPVLSYTSTLEHIHSGPTRPRTLLRQQSLQQPLIHPSGPGLGHPPTTSQSLGQLHTTPGHPGGGGGVGRGQGGGGTGDSRGAGTQVASQGAQGSQAGAGASRCRGGGAGGHTRANPGSWDYMMDQMRNRGLDVKSFLWVLISVPLNWFCWCCPISLCLSVLLYMQ